MADIQQHEVDSIHRPSGQKEYAMYNGMNRLGVDTVRIRVGMERIGEE